MENYSLPANERTLESGRRTIDSVLRKEFREQVITNDATPFGYKEATYIMGFTRLLDSKNFRYILECNGIEDE